MKVYKFMPLNVSHVETFLNGNIHLANWRKFNDVIEGIFLYKKDAQNDFARRINSTKKRFLVACFACSRKWACQNPVGCFPILLRQDMLCCHPMWAHYADDHKGIALELELGIKQNASLEQDGYCLKKVTYLSQRNLLPDFVEDDHAIYKYAETVLLTKHKSWSYEKEIRLIVDTSCLKEDTICFNGETNSPNGAIINSECFKVKGFDIRITKVFTGSAFSQNSNDQIESLRRVLDVNHIPCVPVISERPEYFFNEDEKKLWYL